MSQQFTLVFTTSSSTVPVAPSIIATVPAEGAVGVSITNPITFTFNQDIDPSTLVAGTTVKLQTAGAASVPGNVSYAGTTGTFTPSVSLAPLTTYLFTVTTGVKNRSGISMSQQFTLVFTTSSSTVPVAPSIIATVPAEGAVGVSITNPITFTFNQDIDPSTLAAGTTVKLQTAGAASVPGNVSYAGTTGTFTPSVSLAPLTTYLFTVTTGVKNRSGISMSQQFTMAFTTSDATGSVAPSIIATVPIEGDDNVIVSNTITPISFTFNQDIDPSTLVAGTTVILQSTGGGTVPGTVSYTGTTGKFTPNAFLAPETTYIFSVTTDVKNRSGISMSQEFTLVFTTSAATGPVSLAILATTPSAGDPPLPVGGNVTFTFNQDINPASLIASATNNLTSPAFPSPAGGWRASVYLQTAGPIWVAGTVTMLGRTGTFTPTSALSPNTTYVFTVTTDVKNLSGVGMAQEYKWIFTTATAP